MLCWYGAASPRLANITDDVWPFLFVIFFCFVESLKVVSDNLLRLKGGIL